MIAPTLNHLTPYEWRDSAGRDVFMLLVVGRHESGFLERDQIDAKKAIGPALGLWQFERIGYRGVRTHPATSKAVEHARKLLDIPDDDEGGWRALAYCDLWACVLARALLRTVPKELPYFARADVGYSQYDWSWRPSAKRPAAWNTAWTESLAAFGGSMPTEVVAAPLHGSTPPRGEA